MTEYIVEFAGMGETITASDKQTILKTRVKEGVARGCSCRVGMCLACFAETLEGDVTQSAARGLIEGEAKRFALACMARPQSDPELDHGVYPPSIKNDTAAAGTTVGDD